MNFIKSISEEEYKNILERFHDSIHYAWEHEINDNWWNVRMLEMIVKAFQAKVRENILLNSEQKEKLIKEMDKSSLTVTI